jgi:hypothetical protein
MQWQVTRERVDSRHAELVDAIDAQPASGF